MTEEPIPHWPGRPIELGDHQVHVAHMEHPAQVAAEIDVLLAGIPCPARRLTVGRDPGARSPVR